MKFSKIGVGFIHQGKNKKSIHLIMDPKAQEQLPSHDWQRGMHIFKKRSKKGKIYYEITAPMPDDYEYESGKDFKEKVAESLT